MSRAFCAKSVVLLLSVGMLYLAGNARIALFDRDEPRYAQTSRQMLQSGDWVVPRLMEEVRGAKPIFIYWCQAASMRVFGDNAFAARLPSVVGIMLTLALMLICLNRWIGARRALFCGRLLQAPIPQRNEDRHKPPLLLVLLQLQR